MSESALRLSRDESGAASTPQPVAPPRKSGSATINFLAGSTPLEELKRLEIEIAEDVEKLQAKIATKNTLEVHLRLAGQL